MEFTYLLYSSVTSTGVRRYIRTLQNRITLMLHITKRFTLLINYKCPCLLCSCSWCVQRGHKTHIRQVANNAGQPCPWPSHQIHRISQGTRPWTTAQNRLQGARLCVHHHQSQRDGLPSWGQGTWQHKDGRQQHTRERHCVLPALSNRTSSQQIDTRAYTQGAP